MYCKKCGAEITEASGICTICGAMPDNGASSAVEPMINNEYKPADDNVDVNVAETIVEDVVGNVADPEIAPVMAETNIIGDGSEQNNIEPGKPKTNKSCLKIAIAVIAALLVLGVIVVSVSAFIIVGVVGKANLKNELLRDWSRVETAESTYYTLELDFEEDTIDYNFDSLYFYENIEQYNYKVISENKIETDVTGVHTIEFNEDKTMMIVTPALTSDDSVEYWYNTSGY